MVASQSPTPNTTLEAFKLSVATRLQMDPAVLYHRSYTLADVLVHSPVASNSIDLMEAVAGAMAELDIDGRVELPTLTLDNTIDELVREVEGQLG